MKKINKKHLLIFTTIFLILSIFSIFEIINMDLIWTYGFSYNISENLIPYKDFNMVISPLYSFIFSIPLRIFGNSLIAFKLSHIFIYSLILTLIYNKLGKKTFILIFIIAIQNTICWYNTFSALLVLLILYLLDSNSKYKDIFIGLIIGFILMTKHNIGLTLFLVYIITSKRKFISLVSISIPVLITISILLITNSFIEFIDCCYLGLGNFLDNLLITPFDLIFSIITIIYLLIELIKEKNIKLLYIIAFMIMVFPIIDTNHFLISLIPVTYYILYKNNFLPKYIITILITLQIILNITNIKQIEILTDNNFLKYNIAYKGINNYLKEYSKYINNLNKNTYTFITNSYLLKLYNNENPTFYNLINNGNLGKNHKKYIKEIDKNCKNKNCIFILDSKYFIKNKNNQKNSIFKYFVIEEKNQLIDDFKEYVIKNYTYVETLPTNDRVYKNN